MTWIQKQTSFRCSLARSFPHKLELLSILISEISDERIGKQDKGGIPAIAEYLRFTPPGNAGRGFYTVFEVLSFGEVSGKQASGRRIILEPQQF